MLEKFGEPGGARTRDHRIKSAMLYQLSYRPVNDLRGTRRSGISFGASCKTDQMTHSVRQMLRCEM
jgi:hypothetical protein